MSTHVDVRGLYAALDDKRQTCRLSWRQLAHEVGLSPSTFTRLGNGQRPDVEAFAALTNWLGRPADYFIRRTGGAVADSQPLIAELAPLLRARQDLTPQEAQQLEILFAKAIEQFNAERTSD